MIDLNPGTVQAVTVEIKRPVRFHATGTQAAIPAAVEGRVLQIFDPFWRQFCRPWRRHPAFVH
jgi:hypothetical protein